MIPGLGAMVALSAAVVGVPTLSSMSAAITDDTQYNSAQSIAQFTVSSLGDLINETVSVGAYDNGDWLDPKSGMGEFSVKWTDTSGTIDIGTASSWLALTSSRTFGVSIDSGSGTKTATGTLEIARTDNTGVVLASKSGIVLTARSSPLSPP